jgi:Flp pilus assembly protein TadG
MWHSLPPSHRPRRGAIAVLTAVMMIMLVGMVAFAVDYGYLVKVRTDMQRAADAAALAAARDLIPSPYGDQYFGTARATALSYTRQNLNDATFGIAESDIEFGRFDPATIYSQVTLLPTGIADTVRVTLRRDGATNPLVPLFFACVLGTRTSSVEASATAVLQKAQIMEPGADVLPFATPVTLWNSISPGQAWSAYGDGRLTDASGHVVPGNWGTLDIGPIDNATSALCEQILNGLHQSDLDALYADHRISSSSGLDSSEPAWMNGDPGLSVGIKSAINAILGQRRLIPLYDQLGGPLTGSNVEFRVVGWGVVRVIGAEWRGEVNSRVIVQKCYGYMGELRPAGSLSSDSGYVQGVYTSPVLVQ